MKFSSLTEKLILYFVLLGISAILLISVILFYSTKTALLNRTFDQLTSLRIVKKNQVEQFYADRSRDISVLSLMVSPLCNSNDQRMIRLDSIVGKENSMGRYFSAFYILDRNGIREQGSFSGSGAKLPGLTNVLIKELRDRLENEKVVICDASMDTMERIPFQMIATTIPSGLSEDHSDDGLLVLTISIDAINTIMLNNDPLSGLGLSGETYLVGPDYLMRSTSRFQPGSILKTLVKTEPVTAALSGQSGTVITRDYREIPVLSSYSRIEVSGLRWSILAEIDVQEAMIPIYETRTRILLLSAIIILLFFLFVLFITRRITRPLIGLKEAVIRLGDGNYDIELPVTTRDEIGSLTESFNLMARQIKLKTNELQLERFGRMRSVIDGEEMERQRLSRELHDGIGQLLIAIKLRLESLLYQDGREIKNSIQELKKYFDQIIDEVRRISNNLMPSVLEAFGPAIAFRNLFADTEELSKLKIHFEAKGDFDNLDKKIKTYIYRLTQEAVNNIVKHAEASEVWVNLTRKDDLLSLVIRDNGKGFNPETAGKEGGNGIHNMRERVSLLQGRIMIRSVPGTGTTITVNVPIIIPHVTNQDFPRG